MISAVRIADTIATGANGTKEAASFLIALITSNIQRITGAVIGREHGEEDERKRITLTYAVGGAIHVIYFYSSGRSYDTELLREMICSMVLRIVKE